MAETINHDTSPSRRNRRGAFSPREAADDLGVCVSTIYVLMAKGGYPPTVPVIAVSGKTLPFFGNIFPPLRT